MKTIIISEIIPGEDGKPLTLWRGDSNDYDTFDRKKTRENGFFFTPEEDVAKKYVGPNPLGDRRPNKYHVKAPKVLNLMDDTPSARNFIGEWAKNYDDPESTADGWVDRQSGEVVDPADAVFSGQLFDWEGDWSSRRWRDLQAAAEDAGYDAVILPDWDGDKGVFPSYVVFKPESISRQAMPVVTLKNNTGIDSKGIVDLYLEKMKVTKEQFMREPDDGDFIYRPRGWIGTEANWNAWQQYAQFAKRLLFSAFGSDDPNKLMSMLYISPNNTPAQNDAARKVAKVFVRIQQQVFSSQSLDDIFPR
jgi:hypothetical protein